MSSTERENDVFLIFYKPGTDAFNRCLLSEPLTTAFDNLHDLREQKGGSLALCGRGGQSPGTEATLTLQTRAQVNPT